MYNNSEYPQIQLEIKANFKVKDNNRREKKPGKPIELALPCLYTTATNIE